MSFYYFLNVQFLCTLLAVSFLGNNYAFVCFMLALLLHLAPSLSVSYFSCLLLSAFYLLSTVLFVFYFRFGSWVLHVRAFGFFMLARTFRALLTANDCGRCGRLTVVPFRQPLHSTGPGTQRKRKEQPMLMQWVLGGGILQHISTLRTQYINSTTVHARNRMSTHRHDEFQDLWV